MRAGARLRVLLRRLLQHRRERGGAGEGEPAARAVQRRRPDVVVAGEGEQRLHRADQGQHDQQGDDGAGGEGVVLGLLDGPAAHPADDARDDLRLGERLARDAPFAFQDRQHLVVVAAVELHLRQLDQAVGDAEAGDGARDEAVVAGARGEEAAQFVAAEFGHHHAGDAAAPAADADAHGALGGGEVVVLDDRGPAAVLDAQQHERRVAEGRAVGAAQLLEDSGVRGGRRVAGGRVHLDAVAEAFAAGEDELPQGRDDGNGEAQYGEDGLPGKAVHGRLRNGWRDGGGPS